MNKPIIGGVLPAFITPFSENGKIIDSAARELIDYHLESGLDAFYVGGSTGEAMIMTPEQKCILWVASHQPTESRLLS